MAEIIVNEFQRLLNERELAAARAIPAIARAVAYLNFDRKEEATEILLDALHDFNFVEAQIDTFRKTQHHSHPAAQEAA